MNVLSTEKRIQIVAALVEGNSIRATSRMTGAAKNTVTKLLVDLGTVCERYHRSVMQNLSCERLQIDEIWAFCYAKQKNVPELKQGYFGYGDVWTWVAIDADTKLVPSWLVGKRDAHWADLFIWDLARRVRGQVQVTTDARHCYVVAVPGAFGTRVDFAQLTKYYGVAEDSPERKYSPAVCTGTRKVWRAGEPDPKHVSTSFVERQNLTMRMGMRRFTRLTNGFSKKVRNLIAAVALHFMHYNFCRIHKTLRVTPAMEAGVADHLWEIEELVELLGGEAAQKKSA